MKLVPFNEVFKGAAFENDMQAILGGAQVGRITVSRARKSMSFVLYLPQPVEEEPIRQVESALCQLLGLDQIEIMPYFPKESFGKDGFLWLKKKIKQKFPSANGFLDNADWKLTDGRLSIRLNTGGASYLTGCAQYIKDVAQQQFDIMLCVDITESSSAPDAGEENEKLRRQAIEQASSAATASDKPKKKKAENKGDLILGRVVAGKRVNMSELTLESGKVSVTGEVFAVNHKEIKGRGAWVLNFDMTDYTGSVRVNQFMRAATGGDRQGRGRSFSKDEITALLDAIKPGMYLTVQGRIVSNRFDEDIVLEPDNIFKEKKEERMDSSPDKRVELHLHTRMSAMDGLTDTKQAVARAAKWGHRAIAITDHGVAQSFPEAMDAQKGKDIKILYGCEGYFVNDMDVPPSVRGTLDTPFDAEFVAFDIETTGLNAGSDRIIEIAAVVLKNGELGEHFHSYVNPGCPVPAKITQLTGITNADVLPAPDITAVLPDFLAFVNGRPLAAHNASFDMGFIMEACKNQHIETAFTSLDTLELARALLPDLDNHKLNTVAKALKLPDFTHHRATDDADTVAYMLIEFFELLRGESVFSLQQVNDAIFSRTADQPKRQRHVNHILLLAQNRTGLRNLYKLISDAHLKHFKRYPIVPRSALDRLREGILVGSACEKGELFSAVVRKRTPAELKKIAAYYDFLEIQPIGNNQFMIANGQARDEEELREFNRTIVRLGKELEKPVAATGDVHFLDPKDSVYRAIIMHSKGFADADMQAPLYFKTTDEMLEEFSYLGEQTAREVVIDTPNHIADLCENIKPVPSGVFSPKIKNSAQELEALTRGKASELYGDPLPAPVAERMETELQAIKKHKFDVIYMIAQKLVTQSLSEGYLVGSRGSVGSSVVAFFSDITEVNALPPHYLCPKCKYSEFPENPQGACGVDMPDKTCPVCGAQLYKDGFDIPFATFLGFDGDKKPDIDLNFSGDYRPRAQKQTIELFGEGKVFRAGTIGRVAEKTAYGYVKKYLEAKQMSVSRAEESRLALGCVGVKRTTGQHPGGLIIVPEENEIYEFCPIQHPADDTGADVITTHFDYHSIEENLLKLDLLGHDNPTIIRMLADLTGIDPQTVPLDDKDTMSLFTTSASLGFTDDPVLGVTGACAVPEFGTRNSRDMLIDTKPTTLDELIRISGLSHGTDVWQGNAKDLIAAGTATLKEVVCARDDIMLYLISKGMEQKLAFVIMESVRKGKGIKPEWEQEMVKAQVPRWYIDSCNKIKYMFPKAHAVAYVIMAYRIAYFKVHHPKAFYSAYFTIRAGAFDAFSMTKGIDSVRAKMNELSRKPDISEVEKEALIVLEVCYEFNKRGFSFDPIDLYKSDPVRFTITENGLRPPFTSLAGLGEIAARDIAEQREKRPFLSVEELALRCPKVSKAHIEQLELAQALEGLPKTSQLTLF